MLYTLVYVSKSQKLLDLNGLNDLLGIVQQKNAKAGITGILLYDSGEFLQILEGEEATVLKSFDRIASDTRHDGVAIITQGPIAKRVFSDWKMGFAYVDADHSGTQSDLHGFLASNQGAGALRSPWLRLFMIGFLSGQNFGMTVHPQAHLPA